MNDDILIIDDFLLPLVEALEDIKNKQQSKEDQRG